MRLRKELQTRNQELLRDVEHQVGKATPQLWHSYGTFPSGTKHTPEHTQRVEEIAGLLINDELLSNLTDHEVGLLILACHFHDLGMSGTEEDNLDEESRNRVRREHAISIGDRIRQHWREFGFPNETTAEILAEICKGHRPKRVDGVATWENLDERRIVGPGEDVRIRVVAALVYAADELHIGEDRAPRREEEFNRIESPASRLHWRRHQAVQGPVLRGDKVCFEGTVLTPVFENDLRRSLVKAFKAVTELNSQLESSGIESRCNGVRFMWHRQRLWTLLVARVCSDLAPRSIDKLVEDGRELFANLVDEVVSISGVCDELDSIDARDSQIRSSIDDLVTREFLQGKDGRFVLCDQARTAQYLFDLAKKADEAELHILDQERSQHENNLYQSAFGKRYVRQQLMPRLEAKYSVDLSTPGHAVHTKTALESSPTAARIADLIQPPDTILVQSELFQLACLSGICGDLINDPELILDKKYRHAVDAIVANATQRLPSFLLFIKELAIIRGLSHQQVFEATSTAAENAPFKGAGEDGKSVSFTLTQTFPQSRPEWSMGHLMLARSRSDAIITIKNTAKAPFHVTGINCESPDSSKEVREEPSHISIGSGVPLRAKTATCRGTMTVDQANRTIRLDFHQLAFNEVGKPVIMQFTPTSEGVATCNFSFVPSEMTVGDSNILANASTMLQNDGFTVKVTIEGKPLSDVKNLDLGNSKLSELEARLLHCKPDSPSPLFTRDEDVKAIASCEDWELPSVVDGILAKIRDTRPTATTLFLRYATVDGRDYYEEYLGMAPLSFGFNPPMIKGEGVSQSEFEDQWNMGEIDIKVESTFREEMEELADVYREWASDVTQPFPFKTENDLQFHYCKTRLVIVFHRIIDRQWYKERKVVFGFRPVSKSERYGVEMEYWRSQEDANRAELLNELFQQAAAQEAEQKKQKRQGIEKIFGDKDPTSDS
jgi:hypothetical protein